MDATAAAGANGVGQANDLSIIYFFLDPMQFFFFSFNFTRPLQTDHSYSTHVVCTKKHK